VWNLASPDSRSDLIVDFVGRAADGVVRLVAEVTRSGPRTRLAIRAFGAALGVDADRCDTVLAFVRRGGLRVSTLVPAILGLCLT
jgi:hypothetical protein